MRIKLTYFTQSFIIIFSAVFIISITSCGNDDIINNTPTPEPVDTSSFEYPFTIGSHWNYTKSRYAENIRPDSIRYKFSSYPLTSTGYTEILYDTNVIIGGPVRVFYDRTITGNDTLASRYYYSNSTNSMVCYGYRGSSTPAFPFRIHNGINNMSENDGYGYRSLSDTYIVFSPIVIALKYPVLKNTEWMIFNFGSNIISKKYLSWENYHLDTATIACIKTQRIWSNNSDYIYYDYYSKYGQMKREYISKNQPVTNTIGLTIGYVDYRDLYLVTSFNIAAQ